jgi:hypothetical protein
VRDGLSEAECVSLRCSTEGHERRRFARGLDCSSAVGQERYLPGDRSDRGSASSSNDEGHARQRRARRDVGPEHRTKTTGIRAAGRDDAVCRRKHLIDRRHEALQRERGVACRPVDLLSTQAIHV